jgi:hypothetical protein
LRITKNDHEKSNPILLVVVAIQTKGVRLPELTA